MMIRCMFDIKILEMMQLNNRLGYGHGNCWLRWAKRISELIIGSDVRH